MTSFSNGVPRVFLDFFPLGFLTIHKYFENCNLLKKTKIANNIYQRAKMERSHLQNTFLLFPNFLHVRGRARMN